MKNQARLICVVGQTATGKSSLALRIAQAWNGEIICADSWTIRRDVDIGTAKPSAEERQLVPHHLLDVINPDEDFNAALFKDLANKAISDISNRGRVPIMVGGTGLYIDSVIYDYSFSAVGNRRGREQLNTLSLPELLQKISDLDIELGNVDVRNKRRLIRLIETNGAQPTKQNLRDQTLLFGLHIERSKLKQRITDRLDTMLEAGLEEEVRQLSTRYGWDCEALKGICYAQWREYFLGSENRDQVRQKIINATINLAKRQSTWFQRNKSIHWLDAPVKWPEVVDLVTTFLDNNIS
ncbi:MAG TPA: tRNA (adenosine(37)-N6)-dimethylallyltransferase MiaA [Candidatus Saccharimonadales bacterium]|nr:tRNA (adenosine(37)-N6)-dimethylallyltransferase MiaA [Candidatus Saccharimonadales bacterium]